MFRSVHCLLTVFFTQNLVALAALRAADPQDWPMWNYDAARSGNSPEQLADSLHLQWVRKLPEPRRAWPKQLDDSDKLEFDVSYSPIVVGDKIYIASMANDSVKAYRVEDGSEVWSFYADGPVRLAPVAWEGNIYFGSDDGHLYCVDGATGQLQWRFRAAPVERFVLGNNRLVSMWAARGGPVIKDGIVYFAAGVWPFMGTFVVALDAKSGEVVWSNKGDSTNWQRQPHGGAFSFGGIAPQGYLAATGDRLIVSGGRSTPALFDRQTGELLHLDIFGKGPGGYRVAADDKHYFNHGAAYSLRDGSPAKAEPPPGNSRLRELAEKHAGVIDGEIFEAIAAQGRLFVTTEDGSLYCFGPNPVAQPICLEDEMRQQQPATETQASPHLAEAVNKLGPHNFYALVLGVGDGGILKELAATTNLHIVGVDSDPDKIDELRRQLDAAGLYGSRIALLPGNPAEITIPETIFSLIVVPDPASAGLDREQVRKLLRPYGGVALYGDAELITRDGPLPGAGQWTHQYADAARTTLSNDQLVRLPLGVLWYGSESHDNVLPRHALGPRPQITGGRLVILGVDTISARDVYTGREIWAARFPGLGHPFTNLELEEKWQEGEAVYMDNIPGAAYIGSPVVTLEDSVYLRHRGKIHRLDAATGEELAVFPLYPDTPGAMDADWGPVNVAGDLLITTADPHQFDDTQLGWLESWNATSSRRLVVLDRFSGKLLWERPATVGFRHNAIAAGGGKIFLIDGLSEKALEFLARRGAAPTENSRVIALDAATGKEIWQNDSKVFGTFLAYSEEHDVLLESGSRDTRRPLPDEPVSQTIARRGADGEILWTGSVEFPAAIRDDTLIPGRPGSVVNLLTGERVLREHPLTGEEITDGYAKFYGCAAINASQHLLLFRSGAAGFADLENDGGTGNFGGFKSGCTSNLIAADGVLNAPDYTRTCTCSYQNQTSLGLVHMPDADIWTSVTTGRGKGPMLQAGLNLGAPGNRRAANGTLWVPIPSGGAPAPQLEVLTRSGKPLPADVMIVKLSAPQDTDPGKTLDGNASTAWSIQCNRGEFDQGIVYRLNKPATIDHVEVTWSGPTDTEFQIDASADGKTWTPLHRETSRGTDGKMIRHDFPATDAIALRMNFGKHGDLTEDRRGRREVQTASIGEVRIGGLEWPNAAAYFLPPKVFRNHSLQMVCDAGMPWVAASGIEDLAELILHGVGGNGELYSVSLHFAEPEPVTDGDRKFDIFLQGKLVEEGVEILSLAGGARRGIVKTFPGIPVADSLHIELKPHADSKLPPILSGVEIVRSSPPLARSQKSGGQ